jgi:integrase
VHGTAATGKAPLVTAEIRRLLDQLPAGLLGVRDRALLLLGFASALRRSELVALDLADVTATSDGLVVVVRRSKTDQDAAGRTLGISYGSHPDSCPVRATTAWTTALRAALGDQIGDGPLGTRSTTGRCSPPSTGTASCALPACRTVPSP